MTEYALDYTSHARLFTLFTRTLFSFSLSLSLERERDYNYPLLSAIDFPFKPAVKIENVIATKIIILDMQK